MIALETVKRTDTETIKIKNFEDILEKKTYIYFSGNRIEIPGILIFAKEHKGFLSQLLNPGVDIIYTKEEDFKDMIALVEKEDKNVMFLERKTLPTTKVRIQLDKLKEETILFKKEPNMLLVDNVIFTTSELEFHGTGMFTSREVFKVSEEEFKVIEDLFL